MTAAVKPIVKLVSSSTSMYVQPNEVVSMICTVSGLPLPNIIWESNGSTLTTDNKTTLSESECSNCFR